MHTYFSYLMYFFCNCRKCGFSMHDFECEMTFHNHYNSVFFFFWASTTSCFLFTLVKKNPCYLRRMDNSITLHNWVTETQIYEITVSLCAGRVLPIYGPAVLKQQALYDSIRVICLICSRVAVTSKLSDSFEVNKERKVDAKILFILRMTLKTVSKPLL